MLPKPTDEFVRTRRRSVVTDVDRQYGALRRASARQPVRERGVEVFADAAGLLDGHVRFAEAVRRIGPAGREPLRDFGLHQGSQFPVAVEARACLGRAVEVELERRQLREYDPAFEVLRGFVEERHGLFVPAAAVQQVGDRLNARSEPRVQFQGFPGCGHRFVGAVREFEHRRPFH